MLTTIIGDVHGKYPLYFDIINHSKQSVQVGDFGHNTAWQALLDSKLDPTKHVVIPGNHDDYDLLVKTPYFKGDYGISAVGNMDFAHARGAFSLNAAFLVMQSRLTGEKLWWYESEMNYRQMKLCETFFRDNIKVLPQVMITHCAPESVKNKVLCYSDQSAKILEDCKLPSNFVENTSLLLDGIFSFYQPDIWVFGHYHTSFQETINGTTFIGLRELETIRI